MAHLPKGQGVFLPPFQAWLASNIPAVYDNTMTYYEELCALIKYLQDQVVPAINTNAAAVTTISEAVEQLQDYVAHYFENLDVQEEINNKLDEMAEDGTLQEIITAYIQANVAWTFDTVAEMKSSTNLVGGSYARTLGFYSINDGGGAIYKISESGTANEKDVIAVGDLYANLVTEKRLNVRQFGAHGDGDTDDTTFLQYVIDYAATNSLKDVVLPNGVFVFTTLTIKQDIRLVGEGGVLFVADDTCTDNTRSYYIIVMKGGSTVKNVEINGNKENNTSYMVADLITTDGNNITIDGCHMLNVIDSGVMFSETINSIVTNCRIDDARDCGIYCNNNNTDKIMNGIISGNIIKNAGASGIAMKRGCRYLNIRDNILTDCLNGITSEQANTTTDFAKEFSITNNTIYNSTAHNGVGIDTRGGYNCSIVGNRIINITTSIMVQGSHDVNVEGNIIEFHATSAVTTNVYGVLLQGRSVTGFNICYNINVLNNIFNYTFYNSSTYQQHVIRINNSDNSSNIVISGNRITGDAYTTGITTANAIHDLIITNNTINIGASATAYALQGVNLFANNNTTSGTVSFSKAQYYARDNYHRYFTNTSTSAPTSTTDFITGDVIFAKAGNGSIFAWVYDSGSSYKHVNYDA